MDLVTELGRPTQPTCSPSTLKRKRDHADGDNLAKQKGNDISPVFNCCDAINSLEGCPGTELLPSAFNALFDAQRKGMGGDEHSSDVASDSVHRDFAGDGASPRSLTPPASPGFVEFNRLPFQQLQSELMTSHLHPQPLFYPQPLPAQASIIPTTSRAQDLADAAAKKPRLTGFAAKHGGTSTYRGVSWHTQTGRWKAQIKVNGKDVNLGRHKQEIAAAQAYDRAAICARGVKDAKLNFNVDTYKAELPLLLSTPLDQLAATLRGVEERVQAQTSRFHGVRLNKRTKKWEAYIRVAGKHVHLGCHDCEVAAAQAFDQAAIVRHAHNLGAMGGKPQLVTNFPPEYYQELLQQLVTGRRAPVVTPSTNAANPSCFYQLDEKYVQNLLDKCRQQGGHMDPNANPMQPAFAR